MNKYGQNKAISIIMFAQLNYLQYVLLHIESFSEIGEEKTKQKLNVDFL